MDFEILGSSLGVCGSSVFTTSLIIGMDERNESLIFSSLSTTVGSSMICGGCYMSAVGHANKLQEISEYVSSLSDEELESLSEDLVGADISDDNIAKELDYRINLLSENNDEFSSDEYRELLQKSVVDYLDELRTSDFEEYNKIMDLLSEGDYNDGDIPKKSKKNIIIKKMDF